MYNKTENECISISASKHIQKKIKTFLFNFSQIHVENPPLNHRKIQQQQRTPNTVIVSGIYTADRV